MTSRRKRRRRVEPESLATLLVRAMPEVAARSSGPVPRDVWHAIVGRRIADKAHPVSLERGTLYVRVGSASWAQELTFRAATIVERLAAQGFAVERVRFRVGTVEPPALPPLPPRIAYVPAPIALPDELAATLADVGDAPLAAAIGAAASASLAWGEAHTVEAARAAAPRPVTLPGAPPPRGR